jgi:hypothetical protein
MIRPAIDISIGVTYSLLFLNKLHFYEFKVLLEFLQVLNNFILVRLPG